MALFSCQPGITTYAKRTRRPNSSFITQASARSRVERKKNIETPGERAIDPEWTERVNLRAASRSRCSTPTRAQVRPGDLLFRGDENRRASAPCASPLTERRLDAERDGVTARQARAKSARTSPLISCNREQLFGRLAVVCPREVERFLSLMIRASIFWGRR